MANILCFQSVSLTILIPKKNASHSNNKTKSGCVVLITETIVAGNPVIARYNVVIAQIVNISLTKVKCIFLNSFLKSFLTDFFNKAGKMDIPRIMLVTEVLCHTGICVVAILIKNSAKAEVRTTIIIDHVANAKFNFRILKVIMKTPKIIINAPRYPINESLSLRKIKERTATTKGYA